MTASCAAARCGSPPSAGRRRRPEFVGVVDGHGRRRGGRKREGGLLVAERDGPQAAPLDFNAFPPGSRLRVLTNHACMTGAMYDRYYVTDGSDSVVDEWDRVNGW